MTAPAEHPDNVNDARDAQDKSSSAKSDADGDAVHTTNGKRQMTASPEKEVEGDDTAVQSSDTAGEESPKPSAKRRTLCGVCHKEAGKYKCPRCTLAYCSVACSKTHRENHPPPPPTEAAPAAQAAAVPEPAPTTSDKTGEKGSSANPFSVLDDSADLARLFAKYPNLRTRLRSIYEATLPPQDNGENKADARFPWAPSAYDRGGRGGRGGGRGGRGGWRGRGGGRGGFNGFPQQQQQQQRHPQTWTREMGLRQGQKALRLARTDPGEDGDGVREYCELVIYLLSRQAAHNEAEAEADNGVDATMLVRQEVVKSDVELIRQLLEAEGRQ